MTDPIAILGDLEGDLMHNQKTGSSDPIKRKPPSGPEVDYSPKTYTFRKNVITFGKMVAVAALIFLVLWISQKYTI
jgi:hypothetical protein